MKLDSVHKQMNIYKMSIKEKSKKELKGGIKKDNQEYSLLQNVFRTFVVCYALTLGIATLI